MKNSSNALSVQLKSNGVISPSPSSLEYLDFASDLVDTIHNAGLHTQIYTSFIYGSVARGQADTGRSVFETRCFLRGDYYGSLFELANKSDIDIAIVVDSPPKISSKIKTVALEIYVKHPKNNLVSILLFPENNVKNNLSSTKTPDIYKRLFGVTKKIILLGQDKMREYQNIFEAEEPDYLYEGDRLRIREIVSKELHSNIKKLFLNRNAIFEIAPRWANANHSKPFQEEPTSAFSPEILKIKIPERHPSSSKNIQFDFEEEIETFLKSEDATKWH